MSQPDGLGQSIELGLSFSQRTQGPLSVRELERLYALADWGVVVHDARMPKEYGRFSTLSLFKALALPYLVPISTERALARYLEEREPLQVLCGLTPGQVPKRATFWHFRRKYRGAYPDLMLRVLIALALSGLSQSMTLHFASPIPDSGSAPQGRLVEFEIDGCPIEAWTTIPGGDSDAPIVTVGKTWDELYREQLEHEARTRRKEQRRKGLASGLGLPAEVRAYFRDDQTAHFVVVKPRWLDSPRRQADTLTTVGPASFRPYTVCNVLVVRTHEGQQQILLSRRLSGYGKGTYALPGGKALPDESLQECAARELWEETRIRLKKSRLVSLRRFSFPGKPRVVTVGVLAEEYEGKPQLVEKGQNGKWEWFNLDTLPQPLFAPTLVAISQYQHKTYPDLQWSDVEVFEPKERVKQLELSIGE